MNRSDFTLPPLLATLVRRLPSTPPSWALVTALNQLVQRGILPADMSLLEGKRFAVEVRDAGLQLQFAANAQRFTLDGGHGAPDLRLSANLVDFARMMRREEDPDTLFFNRKLVIEGDTELGLIVKNLLDSVDWSHTPLARFMAA